jgi:hypothetical protein
MTQEPQCFNCKHYKGRNEDGTYRCSAFDNIPMPILINDIWHDKRLPEQDNNIIFERVNPEKQS